MSEPVHISKIIEELAEQYEWARGHNMSKSQQDDAEAIIDHADKMLMEGYDSLTVLRRGLHKLNQLGLNLFDFRYYRQRLEKITGVKA
jgi:predicted KAP-like P-loop ATPase